MNIKVISEEIIKPSFPTPNHLHFLPASLLDHVQEPILMPLIFFFDSQNTIATKISTTEALDRLKRSLPNALSMFYPLAGRIHNVNHIDCNDEGVPYARAIVDKRLEDVIHKAEVPQLDKLLPPYGQQGYSTLLLAIQVNVFACGGLAVAVKLSHAISDAFSFLKFVNTWAAMANNIDDLRHTLVVHHPVFDTWKLFPSHRKNREEHMSSDLVCVDPNPEFIKHRPVAKWFLFSKTKIDELRSQLISHIDALVDDLPSLAMVLSAFIWSRFKVAVSCHSGVNKTAHESFHSVNIRPRVITPNEQSYYFGNMVVNAIAKSSSNVVISGDADKLECLRRMMESIGKIRSDDDEFIRKMQEGEEGLEYINEQFERLSKGEIVLLGFSNIQSLPVYEADFGWGKPVWVTSATLLYNGMVILVPVGPSNRDIVAYINLSDEDMAKLESDAEFSTFVSKAPHLKCKL